MANVRIVCMDFQLTSPVSGLDPLNSEFRGSSINKVPIIRIFGISDEGGKVCLHVHGVFPYFYIPFEGTDNPSTISYQIAAALDKTLNISMGQASSNHEHVYKISLVSAYPLYGYHVNEHQFLKISFYNPLLMKKAAALLQNGCILGKNYQPHESHIPYHQQFMIDYNLHGMNVIRLSKVHDRYNPESPKKQTNILNWKLKKISTCKVEMDVHADYIENRHEVERGKMTLNPGIKYICEDEKQRRRLNGEDSQLSPCLTQNRVKIQPTASHLEYKALLDFKLNSGKVENKHTDLELSVYPAESLSGSTIDNLDLSTVDTSAINLDQTLVDVSILDEDAELFIDMLKDKENDEDIEEDSILSQVVKEDDDDNEHELDMTSPLESTPTKSSSQVNRSVEEDDIWNDSFFDNTIIFTQTSNEDKDKEKDKGGLVPQLDGALDTSSDEEFKACSGSKKVAKSEGKLQTSSHSKAKESLKETSNSPILNRRKFKKKLKFSTDNSNPDETIVEEEIVCKLVADKPRKSHLFDIINDSDSSSTAIKKIKNNDFSVNSDHLLSSENDDVKDVTSFLTPKSGSSLTSQTNYEDFNLTNSQDVTYELDASLIDYQLFVPKYKPPALDIINSTAYNYNIPNIQYSDPFYSDFKHVTNSVDVGHNTLVIKSNTINDLNEYKTEYSSILDLQLSKLDKEEKSIKKGLLNLKLSYCKNDVVVIEPAIKPPTIKELNKFNERVTPKINLIQPDDLDMTLKPSLTDDEASKSPKLPEIRICSEPESNSQNISAFTLNNTHGFKFSFNNLQEAKSCIEYQYTTTLVTELHIETRDNLKPNPLLDKIMAIFYTVLNDVPGDNREVTGIFINKVELKSDFSKIEGGVTCIVKYYENERDTIEAFLKFIKETDPDILIGYEIEMSSWGYLIDRCSILGFNIISDLSRIPNTQYNKNSEEELHTDIKITGRIVLNLWRLMKYEIALQSYTLENVAYQVLHQRLPVFSSKDLNKWWNHESPKYKLLTVNFYLTFIKYVIKIIEHFDIIGRTSELAKLFGILFYEVLSRGSQFRVESMMLRLAKPLNYIPVSPSIQQRAHMCAPEFLPLILEPESKFYKDPVIVLDFQSLYPSIIIAYNYCFSTSIGKIQHLGTDLPFQFGATQLKISKNRVNKLLRKDMINFSPCKVGFVKKEIRQGILPKMLEDILNTRLLVKKSMKKDKANKALQRVLFSRQLGLKLIANVTYGYTSANFSGRMPAVEIGDSVVAKARETLQRAIHLVEKNTKWGVKVVYGDTDSMFVHVPGRTKDEAFKIGAEIAEAVTNDNPSPMKLKLEKVYHPCILQTKKRYVGYMYETLEQLEPVFEAKGIETVRRDGCPAAAKMLEKCIRLLFETTDVSLVRKYVVRQFDKIIAGRISIQDLTFAKEYRGEAGYKAGACVPALEIARKKRVIDSRSEPRSGERVPYVIVNGPPGLPLIKLVKCPRDLLNDPGLSANALYYITKAIIPPINRCFLLIGADLNAWFNEMPRRRNQNYAAASPTKGPKTTIAQYFANATCTSCSHHTADGICEKCRKKPQESSVILHEKVRLLERNYYDVKKICETCCGRNYEIDCTSLDCPVLYKANQTSFDLQHVKYIKELIHKYFD